MAITGKLSALAFKAATAPGTYQDGGGLMLVVKPSGSRSWVLRATQDGKRRDFGIGSANTYGLAEARKRAGEIRAELLNGIDPAAKRRADRKAKAEIPTFKRAAEQCHAERKETWRNEKHREDWISSLRAYAFPDLGNVRVDQVTAPMVRDVLLKLWLSRPETARRVRQRIRAVLGWAASNGHREPLDLSVIAAGLPKQPRVERHLAAMDFDAVPAFMATLRAAPQTVGRMALQFAILTAARSGEVRGATWEEIDLEAKLWTIPGERMKAGRAHTVPLSAGALAVLADAKGLRSGKAGEPIFPGTGRRRISDMTITKVMRNAGQPETVHGFRSAFKDWASERTSFPDAVSEAALAHTDRNKTRAAYRRTTFEEKRRQLMDAWCAFVGGGGAEVANLADARRKRLTAR